MCDLVPLRAPTRSVYGHIFYDNECFTVEYVDFKIPPQLRWVEHGAIKITWKNGTTYYIDNGAIQGKYSLPTAILGSLKSLSTPAALPAGWSEWKTFPLNPPRGKPGYWW
jgi:hypothetical protein